jgi:hypothetical protein
MMFSVISGCRGARRASRYGVEGKDRYADKSQSAFCKIVKLKLRHYRRCAGIASDPMAQ